MVLTLCLVQGSDFNYSIIPSVKEVSLHAHLARKEPTLLYVNLERKAKVTPRCPSPPVSCRWAADSCESFAHLLAPYILDIVCVENTSLLQSNF